MFLQSSNHFVTHNWLLIVREVWFFGCGMHKLMVTENLVTTIEFKPSRLITSIFNHLLKLKFKKVSSFDHNIAFSEIDYHLQLNMTHFLRALSKELFNVASTKLLTVYFNWKRSLLVYLRTKPHPPPLLTLKKCYQLIKSAMKKRKARCDSCILKP